MIAADFELKFGNLIEFWLRELLIFDFLQKNLSIVSPPHFVYDFSSKMFLMSYYINQINFIVLLP